MVGLNYYLTLIPLSTSDLMMTRLRTNPLLWIVPASIAMAVGTTATLMTILEYNQTLGISGTHITLSIGGIAIGIIGLVIGYYFQNKPSKRMHRLFTKFKKKRWKKKASLSKSHQF